MSTTPAAHDSSRRRKVRDYAARHGYWRTGLYLAGEGLRHAGVVARSIVVGLRPEHVVRSAFDPGVALERCLLTTNEVAGLPSAAPDQLPAAFLAKAEARGDLCYAILDKGVLVSFGWYALTTATLYGRPLSFSRDYVFMYHGYTARPYRGQHLHALGLAEALAAFCARGRRGLVSVVDAVNFDSLASTRRLGFIERGSILHVGRGVCSARFATPATREFGIRIVEA
jgi:hypothetical protein